MTLCSVVCLIFQKHAPIQTLYPVCYLKNFYLVTTDSSCLQSFNLHCCTARVLRHEGTSLRKVSRSCSRTSTFEGLARRTHYIHLVHSEKFNVLCTTLNAFSHKSDTLALHSTADNAFCANMLNFLLFGG